MVAVPQGFKFKPTDQDLIRYLQCKAKDEDLPCQGVISEANLYGQKEPWEIFHDYGEKESRYFFTRLKKNKVNGRRFVRKVGNHGGTWNGETKGKPIFCYQDKKKIGIKKSLSYSYSKLKQGRREGGEVDRKFKWLMTEYTLSDDSLKDPNLKHLDYAICLIKRKKANNDVNDDDDEEAIIEIDRGGSQGLVESKKIVKTEAPGEPQLAGNFDIHVSLQEKQELMNNAYPTLEFGTIIPKTREPLAVDEQPQAGNYLWDYIIEEGGDVMTLLENQELKNPPPPPPAELSQPIIDQHEEQETEDDHDMDSAAYGNFGENLARELLHGADDHKLIHKQAQISNEELMLLQNPFHINNWATDLSANYLTNWPAL